VTRAQGGAAGILVNYTGGDTTLSQRGASAPQLAQRFLDQIEPVLPGLGGKWNGKATLDYWPTNPWSKGAYSYWRVGQYTRFAGSEYERSANCHFCGEHTSIDSQGYLNGAVETGQRAAAGHFDALQFTPLTIQPDEGVFLESRDPYGAVAIEADAVGGFHLAEAAAQFQTAVGGDVVIAKAPAIHLGHDQAVIVGRDRDAVGKPQAFGDNPCCSMRHHQDDAADGAAIRRRRQIEAEIADKGTPEPVDDHVVDRAGRDPRQVGVGRKLTVRIGQQAFAEHRQHDQPAVRQDTEAARRVVVEFRMLLALT